MEDRNSSINQDIKRKFVEREVLTCFSFEMVNILEASQSASNGDLPTYEDIENSYLPTCTNCGYQGQFEETEADIDGEGHFDPDTIIFLCPECRNETKEESETEPQEIFEWWIVTSWLYDKLKAKDEPVLEWGNNYYWGRTCTGQAILLDGVISDICEEMGILDGQAYSWAKK